MPLDNRIEQKKKKKKKKKKLKTIRFDPYDDLQNQMYVLSFEVGFGLMYSSN